MSRSYSVPGSGTYYFSDVSEPRGHGWSDPVGRKLSRHAKSAVDRFNPAHARVWEKASPLLEVREDDITYQSQAYEIEGLVFHE